LMMKMMLRKMKTKTEMMLMKISHLVSIQNIPNLKNVPVKIWTSLTKSTRLS